MRKAGGQIASLMNDKSGGRVLCPLATSATVANTVNFAGKSFLLSGGRVLCPLATSAEWEDDRFVQALAELEPLIGLGILGLSRANTVCVGAHAAI